MNRKSSSRIVVTFWEIPTPQEFKNILDDYEIKIWLAAMDLDVSDVEELFHLLDDGGDAWMIHGWTFGWVILVQGQGVHFCLTRYRYRGYVYYIDLYNIPRGSVWIQEMVYGALVIIHSAPFGRSRN